jgi:hypothetical protein
MTLVCIVGTSGPVESARWEQPIETVRWEQPIETVRWEQPIDLGGLL